MKMKIIRKGQHIGYIDIRKQNNGEWEPPDDYAVMRGDVLESVDDGVQLEVLYSQPTGKIRAGLQTKIIE